MPKAGKNHKGAQKRFKVSKKKKVIFAKVWNNHLKVNKGKSCKTCPGGKVLDSKKETKNILDLFPH